MPDTVENGAPVRYDRVMEARVSRLEEDMRAAKASNRRVESMVAGVRVGLARIETLLTSTLPYLAAKEELAEKPGRTYLIGLLAAYAAGLAALAVLK